MRLCVALAQPPEDKFRPPLSDSLELETPPEDCYAAPLPLATRSIGSISPAESLALENQTAQITEYLH